MIVWDRCTRLGGARGPPGIEGVTGATLTGRGVGSTLGGLFVSKVLTGDDGVLRLCSFFRLVLRPSAEKNPPGDFVEEEDEEDVTMIVDALEGPLRGAAANAG